MEGNGRVAKVVGDVEEEGFMSRDYIYIEEDDLVIVVDNCGSVGSLEFDSVESSAFQVAYFTTRVVLMELLSIRSKPIACSISIFNNDKYEEFIEGVTKAFTETGIEIPHISSSESNFTMRESAFSITLFGKGRNLENFDSLDFGVIGIPYFGSEVITNTILELSDFMNLLSDDNIKYILPVGSKGIAYEVQSNLNKVVASSSLDINKSAGPATAVIVGFVTEHKMISKYGDMFSKLIFK